MNLGFFSADGVVAICGVLTIVGGTIAWLLQKKDELQAAQLKAALEAIEQKFSTSDQYQRDLKSNIDTAWRKIDELREGRALLWTRAEQERFEAKIETTTKDLRSEIRADLESLGSRLSLDLANLGNRLDNTVRELMSKPREK